MVGWRQCHRGYSGNIMLFKQAYKRVAIAAVLGVVSQLASATEEFFVPFPEDHTLAFLRDISSTPLCPAGTPIVDNGSPSPTDDVRTITDFVVRVDNTLIVIDHFEDGYEPGSLEDIALGGLGTPQVTTRVYGDGDISNGAVPGVTTNAGDILVSGQVVVFEESIDTGTQIGDVEIDGAAITGGGTRTQDGLDGGDRIFATETINVTRAQWADGPGTLFAGAFELFPLSQWGQSFTLPVGEDSAAGEFAWTGLTLMAANDGTDVSIDVNADGDFNDVGIDVNTTINRGETVEVFGRNNSGGQTTGGLSQGARIVTSDIVQTNIISGEECSNYAARWFTLFPDALLGNNYYEPVSTRAADATKIYLYNPATSPISINWETTAGVQTPIIVPGRGVVAQEMPVDSGARFYTDSSVNSFGALTVTDVVGGAESIVHDWGHASTSQRLMGNIVQVGYAEGDDPSRDDLYPANAGIGENSSPVWLVADNLKDPTDTQYQICVDVSGDGGPNTDPNTGNQYDYTFLLDRLDSARLYDGGRDTPNATPAHLDGDQSGMLAFVCDGSDAILAAAWGQAPDTAARGIPAVDLGTTVRSVSADVAFLGDTVFEDTNSNGVRDPGENGIQGVTVILTPSSGVNLGAGPGQPITTTTDFNGSYLFPSLISGDYTVEVIPPSGWVQTFDPDASNGDPVVLDDTSSPTIVDAIGRLDQDFGYVNNVPAGQIGDFIYNDVNGNGIQEPGETGIPGIDVELCTLGAFTDFATDNFDVASYSINAAQWSGNWIELNDDNNPGTATNGGHGFGGVDGFNLNIFADAATIRGNVNGAGPSITRQFDPSSFDDQLTATLIIRANAGVTYELGDDQLDVQISISGGGFTSIGTIEAANLSTAFTPVAFTFDSQGASNVRIRLQVNGNNITGPEVEALILDNIAISGRAVTCSTLTTDASGFYLFTGQADGFYSTTVLNPPAGATNTDDPSGDANNTNEFELTSSGGFGGNLEQDYGYFIPAQVTGHVYFDVNGNGVQDVGEPNIPNLDVEITDSLGNLHVVTTDANGDYISEVPPGSTIVKLDETDPDYPTDFIQTDGVDPNPVIAVAGITVDAGDDGFYQGNSIGDTVYQEQDGVVGVQDGTDPGIPNLTVTLTPPAGVDLGLGSGVPIDTITDASGQYSFVGLPDGTYTITVQQPTGSTQTEDPDGGNDNQSVEDLVGGETDNDQDFGYTNTVPSGLVGDLIFTDANGNGIFDAGDTPLQNIDVQICGDLDDNNATVNTCRTETTNASGNYLFGDGLNPDGSPNAADSGLPATGSGEVYTVTVLTPPAGLTNSADPDNGLPNFSQLTLTAAGGNLDQDFGYFTPALINGHLYFDTNGDGDQDVGEPDLVNIDVIITDVNGNQQVVATDTDGNYVAQVPPGLTTVNVDNTDPQFPLNVTQTEGTDPSTVTAISGNNEFAGNDGYTQLGSIGDLIFFDNTGSGTIGVYDVGVDSGVPAVVVTLTPPGGVDLGNGAGVAITTTTDANGNYLFDQLPAGSYTVSVAAPTGAVQTVDPEESGQCSTCDSQSSVTITAAGNDLDQDFGYSIGLCPVGTITFDEYTLASANSTTIFNSEYSTGGADNTNSPLAGGQGFAISATGGENVAVVYNTNAGTGGNDPDLEISNTGNALIVQEGGNLGGIGEGGFIPDDVVGGLITFDFETPITEFSATLVDFEGPAATLTFINTATGASVSVRHDQIVAGSGIAAFEQTVADCPLLADEEVCVINNTITAQELATFGSVVMNSFNRIEYQFAASGAIDDMNFRYDCTTSSAIGDTVFSDTNANGVQDPGEAGIPGINVQICGDLDDNDVTPATCRIETTDANGNYLFGDNLTADKLTADPADDPLPLTNGTEDYTIEILNPPAGQANSADPDGGVSNVSQLTLPNALANLDQDFGYTVPGTLGDLIYYDIDGDGVFNGADSGIAGVLVRLDLPDGSTEFDTTDASGIYSFDTAPGGDYTITVDPNGNTLPTTRISTVPTADPDGGADNSSVITLAPAASNLDQDFGYQPNKISGNVSEDTTGNGAGDTNLAGVIVQLYSDPNGDGDPSDGALLGTATTDSNGNYEFITTDASVGVPEDDYVVLEIDPAGLSSVSDGDITPDVGGDVANSAAPLGNLDNILPVTVGAGEVDADNNFVDTNVGSIAGRVWFDEDLDGILDTEETGITGVSVQLLNNLGAVIATTVTDESGNYLFPNLTAGDYTINVVDSTLPTGLSNTAGVGGVDPKAVALLAGENRRNVNFGYIPDDSNEGAVGDRVWADADGDGVQDPGEAGISGVVMSLRDGDGNVIATTTTDQNGDYLFTNITLVNGSNVGVADDLSVTIDNTGGPLAGYTPTSGPQSEGGYLSNPVTLIPTNPTVTDLDFGFNRANLNSLSDTFWFDADADGIFDPEENPISGVTVNLYNDADNNGIPDVDANGQPEVVATDVSDSNGDVDFSGLEDGNYIIGVTDINSALNGLNGTTIEAVNALSDTVTLAGGATDDQNSFGYNNPGLISGVVYNDEDSNSDQDPGEAGTPQQTVTLLLDSDGNGSFETTVSTSLTGPDGSYEFDGLVPGDYRVVVTPPAGTQTEDVDSVIDDQTDISLAIGESSVNNDFGYVNNPELFNISGTVFLDPNKNGVEDAGEVGIPEISLELRVPAIEIINGLLDVNGDGVGNGADDGTYLGVTIINGRPDLNDDGSTNGADDGEINGITIINGRFDTNNDGSVSVANRPLDDLNIPALVVATTTTDTANATLGDYSFSGLPAGNYEVAVTDEAALLGGYDITSGLDVLDATIVNADVVDVDFGYIREETTGSLSGTVWVDEETSDDPYNDVPDGNELKLSNVDVYLCTAPLLPAGSTFPGTTDDVLSFERFTFTPTGTISSVNQIRTLGTVTDTTPQSTIGLIGGDTNGAVEDFGYIYQGFINLTETGEYNFRTTSDDGTVLFIDGELIVNNDGLHGNVTVTNQVTLDAGFHSIEIQFFERGGGQTLVAEFSLPSAPASFNAVASAQLSTVVDFCDPLHPNYLATTQTDANGDYSFKDLPPGQYVTDSDPKDIPDGLTNSVDPAPVNVSEGEDVTDVDIGYRPEAGSGALSGFVWVDANGDGIAQPGEAPIGGVTIEVRTTDGLTSGSGTVLFTTTTNPDGSWSVTDITGADLQDGFLVNYVQADIDTQSGLDLSETQPTNFPLGDFNYFPVDLLSDDDNNISFLDFGFQPPSDTAGSLAGTIYADVDQDGNYTPGVDNELEDVSLNLVNAAGDVIATTTTVPSFIDPDTGDERNYLFTGLADGDYQVVITDNQNVTRELNPSETIVNPSTIDTSNAATRNLIDRDAGFVSDTRLRSIGNRFFFDINGDGDVDENEPGIAGIVVQCWLDADASETPDDPSVASADQQPVPGIDNLIRTVTTDASGEYYCTSLPEGQYIVTVADAGGFSEAADSTLITGNAGDNFAKPWTYVVTQAASGVPNYTADFGVSGSNTLSGTIFVEDEDLVEPAGTGIAAGELDGVAGGPSPDTSATPIDDPVVAGVPVDLYVQAPDGSFNLIQTVLSGADGDYSFTGLPDGNYRVVVRPDGTGIDGYGQTGDPDLVAVEAVSGNASDLVCDSPTAALCDDQTGTPIDVDSGSASGAAVNVVGIDFGYQRNFTTTPVTMNSFEATRIGDNVRFVWQTSNEVGHAGFQIYARTESDWQLISDELIPGLPGQALQVRTYEFTTQSDATWFALVDVSNGEEVTAHGPFRVGQAYGATETETDGFDWSQIEKAKPANDDQYDSIEEILRNAELDDEERAERALSN